MPEPAKQTDTAHEQFIRAIDNFTAKLDEHFGASDVLVFWHTREPGGMFGGGSRRNGDPLVAYAMAKRYVSWCERSMKKGKL